MSITLEVDGIQYEDFVEISVLNALDTMSGEFTFISRVTTTENFPIKVGQEAIIRVEGESVITGFIETIRVINEPRTHNLIISGRDQTNDVIDSTFSDDVSFQSDISLKELIEQTLDKVEIPNIKVIDRVGNLSNFTSSEVNKSALGQTIFNFLEETAKKKQVFLITDGLGNIVISRSNGIRINDIVISDPSNTSSNILRSNIVYDDSKRFKKYVVKSQENVSGLGSLKALMSPQNIVDKEASAEDTENRIRSSRTLGINADKAYANDQLIARAQWEANMRRVKSRIYTATMQGHLRPTSDGIWKKNQLVQINDIFCDLNAEMLVNTVEYNLSNDDGSHTVLTFVDPDAYFVQASEPIATQKSNKIGINLTQ